MHYNIYYFHFTSQPVPPGPSSIENDAHGIEKLLLKTQVSLTSFLQCEVKIIHIIVQNNTCQVLLIPRFNFHCHWVLGLQAMTQRRGDCQGPHIILV